jgi:hypothetical protein
MGVKFKGEGLKLKKVSEIKELYLKDNHWLKRNDDLRGRTSMWRGGFLAGFLGPAFERGGGKGRQSKGAGLWIW